MQHSCTVGWQLVYSCSVLLPDFDLMQLMECTFSVFAFVYNSLTIKSTKNIVTFSSEVCCRKFQLVLFVCCRKFQLALCCLLQEVSACFVLFVAGSFSLLCLFVAGSFSLLCLFVAGSFSYQAYQFCLLCVVCCRKFQLALCYLLQEVSACSVLFVAGSFSYQAYRSQLEAMYQDISVNYYVQNGTVNAWFINYHTWLSQTGNVLSSLFPLLPSPLPPFGAWYELFCSDMILYCP